VKGGEDTARRIGVISDTHDLLRPEALQALQGSDLILHAGDICGPEVLQALREIAPVIAVRGNNDHGPWADALPETTVVELGALSALMVHDLKTLRPGAVRDVQMVISGHSHQPKKETRDGVLYFNPGAAGPKRFDMQPTVGILRIANGKAEVEIVPLRG